MLQTIVNILTVKEHWKLIKYHFGLNVTKNFLKIFTKMDKNFSKINFRRIYRRLSPTFRNKWKQLQKKRNRQWMLVMR